MCQLFLISNLLQLCDGSLNVHSFSQFQPKFFINSSDTISLEGRRLGKMSRFAQTLVGLKYLYLVYGSHDSLS